VGFVDVAYSQGMIMVVSCQWSELLRGFNVKVKVRCAKIFRSNIQKPDKGRS
jgi:hypothetical protein